MYDLCNLLGLDKAMSNLTRHTGSFRSKSTHNGYNVAGLTLIEVMIAMAIMLVGVTAVLSLQGVSIKGLQKGNQVSEATFIAAEQLEYLYSIPYWDWEDQADGSNCNVAADFSVNSNSCPSNYTQLTDPLDDKPPVMSTSLGGTSVPDKYATWHPRRSTGAIAINGADSHVIPEVLTREGITRFSPHYWIAASPKPAAFTIDDTPANPKVPQVDGVVEFVRYWRVKRGGNAIVDKLNSNYPGGADAETGTCYDFHNGGQTITASLTQAMLQTISDGRFPTGTVFRPNDTTSSITWNGSGGGIRDYRRVPCSPYVPPKSIWIEVTVMWVDASMKPHFVRIDALRSSWESENGLAREK